MRRISSTLFDKKRISRKKEQSVQMSCGRGRYLKRVSEER